MQKLIDPEKLKKKIRDDMDFDGANYARVKSHINEAEDATVHGRWIEHPKVEIVVGEWISNYECSECCCFYRTHENYCGYCGADMRGNDDDK